MGVKKVIVNRCKKRSLGWKFRVIFSDTWFAERAGYASPEDAADAAAMCIRATRKMLNRDDE